MDSTNEKTIVSQVPDWSVTDYVIDVETSDRRRAGTTSNAYLQMFGQGGMSEPFKLAIDSSVTYIPAFQRGQLDQFIFFNSTSYSRLESIKVWHDNLGEAPSWHLAQITISDTKLGAAFRFPCHRWLAELFDDGKICRELRCTEVTKGPKQAVQVAPGTNVSTLKRVHSTRSNGA